MASPGAVGAAGGQGQLGAPREGLVNATMALPAAATAVLTPCFRFSGPFSADELNPASHWQVWRQFLGVWGSFPWGSPPFSAILRGFTPKIACSEENSMLRHQTLPHGLLTPEFPHFCPILEAQTHPNASPGSSLPPFSSPAARPSVRPHPATCSEASDGKAPAPAAAASPRAALDAASVGPKLPRV